MGPSMLKRHNLVIRHKGVVILLLLLPPPRPPSMEAGGEAEDFFPEIDLSTQAAAIASMDSVKEV